MEETTMFIILVAFLAIGAIGTLVMKSKLSKKGILAPSNFLTKAVMIVGGFVLVLALGAMLEEGSSAGGGWVYLLFVGLLILAGLPLYFINKKANMSKVEAILLTVFELLYGFLTIVIVLLKIVMAFIPLVMGGSSSNKNSGSFSILNNLDKTYQENARKYNEALKEERNKQAEANAVAMGFDSANEAAAYGAGPGREE